MPRKSTLDWDSKHYRQLVEFVRHWRAQTPESVQPVDWRPEDRGLQNDRRLVELARQLSALARDQSIQPEDREAQNYRQLVKFIKRWNVEAQDQSVSSQQWRWRLRWALLGRQTLECQSLTANQLTMCRVNRTFRFVSALVPKRLADEQIGDALELMAEHLKRSSARWPIYWRLAVTIFWLLVNALRDHFVAMLAGPMARKRTPGE
jgi:hypothetical protein